MEENLNFLFQVPGKCPVAGCESVLVPMELLSHLLMHHDTFEFAHEVLANDITIYSLDLETLQPGRNHCLAVLAFGHGHSPSHTLPHSGPLQLCNHMPIMIMLYVTNWASLIASKFVEEHIIPPGEHKQLRIYLLYLVSSASSRLACADIIAMDSGLERWRPGTRVIRNYAASPLVATQLEPCGTDYIYYTAADVAYLSGSGQKILLRFIMHGQPVLFDGALASI